MKSKKKKLSTKMSAVVKSQEKEQDSMAMRSTDKGKSDKVKKMKGR